MKEFARKLLEAMNYHENSWVENLSNPILGKYMLSSYEAIEKAFPEDNGDRLHAQLMFEYGNDVQTWAEIWHGWQVVRDAGDNLIVVECEPGEEAYLKRHHLDDRSD